MFFLTWQWYEKAMDTDDLEPLWTPLDKPDLQTMSVEQLVEYIAEMEAEIARANEFIAVKRDARGAADAVFKI